ncbi:MAG: hypothetical protein ABI042_02135 [Verrucomicrobiota bacterium]
MSSAYQVRRATTDDLQSLVSLWNSAQLPADTLDKRFTEFQIVEDKTGKLLGAIGLQLSGTEGKLHSEAYSDFGLTDHLRPLLWERISTVANNHGLFRLWTDESPPFWKKEGGFTEPAADVLAKKPEAFSETKSRWLVLQLREDRAAPSSLDAEFARFKAEENAQTGKIYQQARFFKGVALTLSVMLFIFVAVGLIYLFKVRSRLPH